jgi:ADP-ribose pyrophosphatase
MFEEKAISSQRIFEGRAFNVRVDKIINVNGAETCRDIVEHADCVAVVPVAANGDIFLVRQFRIAVGQNLLEIPAGGIEKGEDPENAVIRELQEEIGYRPGEVTKIGGVYSSPGFCTEYLHLYWAAQLQPSRLEAEDTAAIEVVRVKHDQILPLIQAGQIVDSKSVAGLLLYFWQTAPLKVN